MATPTLAACTSRRFSRQAAMGVLQSGGYPAHYHVTDICDGCAQGHDGMNYVLASREAIADMVEIHASAIPWDGMVLSSSCDKSIPAHLKAIARLDIPAVFIPRRCHAPRPTHDHQPGCRGHLPARKAQGCHHAAGDTRLQVNRLPFCGFPAPSWARLAQCSAWPRPWACPCPGSALMPATMRDILESAREAGCAVMRLAEAGLRPSDILTPAAFRNAIIVHSAIGGSHQCHAAPAQHCPGSGHRPAHCPCLMKSTTGYRTLATFSPAANSSPKRSGSPAACRWSSGNCAICWIWM